MAASLWVPRPAAQRLCTLLYRCALNTPLRRLVEDKPSALSSAFCISFSSAHKYKQWIIECIVLMWTRKELVEWIAKRIPIRIHPWTAEFEAQAKSRVFAGTSSPPFSQRPWSGWTPFSYSWVRDPVHRTFLRVGVYR